MRSIRREGAIIRKKCFIRGNAKIEEAAEEG